MNEVATFVDGVNQFIDGHSDGNPNMCVAYAAAQIICMVEPGQPNPSTRMDIGALAVPIYQRATHPPDVIGINTARLTEALSEHNISYEVMEMSKDSIDAALEAGYPVIIQGKEGTFVDINGRSPYRWNPDGINHGIILSGFDGDNGYKVRDAANPGGNPAIYDKRKMDITVDNPVKIIPHWRTTMQRYTPGKGDFDQWFTRVDNEHWRCKQTEATLQFNNLAFYQTLSIDGRTLPVAGLPLHDEEPHQDPDGYQWSSQRCERATIIYDPQHRKDNQPGCGASYLAHIGASYLPPDH